MPDAASEVAPLEIALRGVYLLDLQISPSFERVFYYHSECSIINYFEISATLIIYALAWRGVGAA